jgi:LuxR family maltose regulon positive regulatory protein
MARTTPRVEGSTLVGGDAGPITIGSLAWYAWLEQATTFAVATLDGSFTARKERSARAGGYWKAYRKRAGKLQSAYLGKSADLTLERLQTMAASLANTVVASAPVPAAESIERTALPTGTVTFLFTDIEGSTQLWEQHKEAMPIALADHDAIVRTAIQSHRGVVFKTVGDSFHAVFARAGDALAAALASQQALHAKAWGATGPLRVRMALHSGVAEQRDGDYFGLALNRVARILALGHGGQVLLARATHDLVADDLSPQTSLRDLGEQHLKDLSRPEQIFQLISPNLPDTFPPLRTADARPAPQPAPSLLLKTKLYVPPVRANLVSRPHLIERLQAGLQGTLTLISAPAGFGKTTLLIQGLEASGLGHGGTLPVSSVAWVSLDSADRDPARFWSYVLTALDSLHPGCAADALPALQFVSTPPIEGLLTQVLNALTMLPTDAVLVLDDYHVIDSAPIHAAVAFVLDHLPPRLHLVITTRADPPLPLARLRARRVLTELRAADLRFTPDEVAAFLTTIMGLPLAPSEVAALEARTEGWIAGLQLAALAMRDRTDHASFVAAFTGSNRFVVDYLATEVLERLPAHLQRFVLQTSTLERLCGPLCDAVMGVEDWERGVGESLLPPTAQSLSAGAAYSQPLLLELERVNLFVIPLDDERIWYRYHHLFAEVLRGRLQSGAAPAEVVTLHQRASAWFERAELPPEAIQHALVAQDWKRSARLIERYGLLIAARGQAQTVLGWLAVLPEAFTRRQSSLCVLYASTLVMDNQPRAIEPLLQDAEACARDMSPEQARLVLGQVNALRAACMRISGDLERALALAQQALELLPESEPFWRAPVASNLSRAYLVSGDVTAAVERTIAHMVEPARTSGNPFAYLAAIISLARLQALQGRLRAAAATYREALQVVPDPTTLRHYAANLIYYFGLGDLLREWNDLDAAERHLEQGMYLISGTRSQEAEFVLVGYLALARLKQAQGDIDGAATTVAAFLELARQRGFAQVLITRAVAVQTRLALVQGNLAVAAAWAKASERGLGDDLRYLREVEHLALARVRIAQGSAHPTGPYLRDALDLLDQLLAAAEASERFSSMIEIRILQALALQAQDGTSQALMVLEPALQRAAPDGYVRIFVDEGVPMAALLREAHQRGIVPDYTATLLAAFPRTESQGLRTEPAEAIRSVLSPQSAIQVEPLSVRELEILHLIADGHSNQAIADRLVVAVSTVKKHVNNIYGKLDVQSRTQVLLRARELNLL